MKYLIPILSFLLISTITYSEESNRTYKHLKCRLKVQKTSYQLEEPVRIQFQVFNDGMNPVNIEVSDKFYKNFYFYVKSIKNQVISEQEYFYLKKKDEESDEQTIKRVSLGQKQFYGESFDITKFYKLDKPGHYVIQGFFYPNLRNQVKPLMSQVIHIEIRASTYRSNRSIHDVARSQGLGGGKIPYDTVEQMLHARMNKDWNRYFKYIDLRRLINQFPSNHKRYKELKQRYKSLKPSKRKPILNKFKEYLKSNYLSSIGVEKFVKFEVYKSVIENTRKKAKIYVQITYTGDGITIKQRYIYYLYQRNKRWYVYKWTVDNI